MPREGKFKYEFQKGKVWSHRSLTAPFDFPVYKSQEELATEKRNVISSLIPYYNRNTDVVARQQTELATRFNAELHKPLNRGTKNLSPHVVEKLQNQVLPKLQKLIEFVYSKGIREENSIADSYVSNPDATIYIVTNSVAELYPASETFTAPAASLYITNSMKSLLPNGSVELEFFHKCDLLKQLKHNLIFNDKLTAQSREEALKKISPTRGMVNAGQLIITKDEVVNETSLRQLESFSIEYEKRIGFSGSLLFLLLGQLFMVSFIIGTLYLVLYKIYDKELRIKHTSFILMLIVLFCLATLWVNNTHIAGTLVIPYAMIAIYTTTFFTRRLALFVQFFSMLLICTLVSNSLELYLLNCITGVAAAYSIKNAYQRGRLYVTAIVVFLCYSILYFALSLVKDGSIALQWRPYFWFAVNAGLIIALYQLVYIFEKIFSFTSDNTLMEIADTNQPLLRELSEVAPATFQHCIQVANLAENAIRAIGGNPLLVRAGALYHDIGKMNNPAFFIENQTTDFSPHQSLEPEESAKTIIRHVADGVAIARKHRLPEVIVRFIRSHHGVSSMEYFLKKYREKNPTATDFSDFRYPGPAPKSKEQGVLMLADAVEAASRALRHYTTEGIDNLVETVVTSIVNSHQLDDTPLTFSDVTNVKTVFKKKLQNIYHDRVVHIKK